MADREIEYVVLERVTLNGAVVQGESEPTSGEFWREISRVTATRKATVLRDHTPPTGAFNAIPASDWDAGVEADVTTVEKRTLTPLKARPKRVRKQPEPEPEPVEA